MKIWKRHREILTANWHHGFTCFGGPAVQIQTFHDKFVDDLGWIDEAMYQQIFFVFLKALPGSVSVKMLFCINAIHSGMLAGLLSIVMFTLPGAIGMYGLALGISRVGATLPDPVYPLLSGLNAATVGIIALAAVRLASKAITDKVTRFLVYLSGIMGMLYTAIWYYPVLLIGAGFLTLIWDLRYPHACAEFLKSLVNRRRRPPELSDDVEKRSSTTGFPSSTTYRASLELEKPLPALPPNSRNDSPRGARPQSVLPQGSIAPPTTPWSSENTMLPLKPIKQDIPGMSWQVGTLIIVFFVATFATTTTIAAFVLKHDRAFSLFSSLYETGTIIVGGGPVVIPLLDTHTVNVGWVTSRDFLLGLAVIQSFPGPNFNFAVYLGALAVMSTPYPSYVGAGIAFAAMYARDYSLLLALWVCGGSCKGKDGF
ncbi:hypothetical protein ABVK25_012275 [Lepraria finkii]|uniref:Chromate transporter n=1 Tax=Lepraria finkii TaxID=1340010 RepID=A0ABR4AIJ3_9LECA